MNQKKIVKALLTTCFIILFFRLSAQNIDSIQQINQSYYKLDRESIFVHLNKSDYIVGENIWFKGYIYNRHKKRPSIETTNISVGIYDATGNEVSKKLFRGTNGVFNGDFEIDSTYTSGYYYLKASTNWMKNFKESDHFIQRIKIINSVIPKTLTNAATHNIHILPEGGHIVLGVKNTIGYKITNQYGQGVMAKSVEIQNQHNTIIGKSVPNFSGIGKLTYIPQTNSDYKLHVTLNNNETLIYEVPRAQTQGVVLNVSALSVDNVIISLKTNIETINTNAKNTYHLVIHKDGQSINYEQKDGQSISYEVTFSEEILENLLTFKKSDLFAGINIITVFDDSGQPILERLIFNDKKNEVPEINIKQLKKEGDSLVFELQINSLNNNYKNLSLSALPYNTKSLNFETNIYAEFFLKPYVKGTIENPSYYFNNINKRTKYNLDLLLLTQGWSRYEWQDVFNNNAKKIKYYSEMGISFSGKVYNIKKNHSKQLLLHPTSNILSRIISLDSTNTFNLNNLFVYEGDSIQLSILTTKGKVEKPSVTFNNKSRFKSESIINLLPKTRNIITTDDPNYTKEYSYKIPKEFLNNKIHKLSEVTVIANKKKKEVDITKERDYIVNTFLTGKTEEITQNTVTDYGNSIRNYLYSKGFQVRYLDAVAGTNSQPVIILRSRGTKTFTGEDWDIPLIFVNDVPITDGRIDLLLGDRLSEIKRIVISKNGYSYGTRGSQGVIKFYTGSFKRKNHSKSFIKNNILIKQIKFGFSRPKKFFTPKYSSYDDRFFQDYGVIHWEPNLEVFESSKAVFKVLDTLHKNIIFYIVGIDEKGTVISDIKTVNL